jgi:hypothetical protein
MNGVLIHLPVDSAFQPVDAACRCQHSYLAAKHQYPLLYCIGSRAAY